jgi:peptide deformylase
VSLLGSSPALINVELLNRGIGIAHDDVSFHNNIMLTTTSDEEGRAEEAERIKNEQIQKQKEGKGEWHEGIASDSESIVSVVADRLSVPSITNTIPHRSRQTEATSRPTPTR